MRAGSDCWGEAEISPANGVTWVVDCRLEKGRPHAGDRVGRQTAVKALKDLRQRNPWTVQVRRNQPWPPQQHAQKPICCTNVLKICTIITIIITSQCHNFRMRECNIFKQPHLHAKLASQPIVVKVQFGAIICWQGNFPPLSLAFSGLSRWWAISPRSAFNTVESVSDDITEPH